MKSNRKQIFYCREVNSGCHHFHYSYHKSSWRLLLVGKGKIHIFRLWNSQQNLFHYFRIEILLRFGVPDSQISLRLDLLDNQISLHLGVHNNCYSGPRPGWEERFNEQFWFLGIIKTEWNLVVGDTKMEWNLVCGDT